MIRFISPNGERGCLWIKIGRLQITLGLTRELAGFDLTWRDRMLLAIPWRQKLRQCIQRRIQWETLIALNFS